MTDQELLTRIQSRDSNALSILYDKYSKLVFGMAIAMVKDTDEAEDIVQEVFCLIWNKANSWQPGIGNPKNWIVRIAHNRAVNVLRSKRLRAKQSEISIPDENSASGQSVTIQLAEDSLWTSALRNEESSHISEGLTILPEEQRFLIDLAFFQGFSHSEIAEQTGIPLGTIKTRIRTGLLTLRSHLGYLKDEAS